MSSNIWNRESPLEFWRRFNCVRLLHHFRRYSMSAKNPIFFMADGGSRKRQSVAAREWARCIDLDIHSVNSSCILMARRGSMLILVPGKGAITEGQFSTDCWRGVMGQKLLVQEAPGSGSASTNRMEGGEGAGGGELHHFLHQYNQQSHSPGQSLQGGLPLPLSPQSLRHDGASSAGIAGVKREPEDLSSSRAGQQSSKRHKQESPTPPGMYHHHQHQLQVRFGRSSPRTSITRFSRIDDNSSLFDLSLIFQKHWYFLQDFR